MNRARNRSGGSRGPTIERPRAQTALPTPPGATHSSLAQGWTRLLSATTTSDLHVGDEVDLSPEMYGFEFVELAEKQPQGIRQMCKALPLFRSMLDI
jgi:hypothetical protein